MPSGCSNMKYRCSRSWVAQTLIMNRMWSFASSSSRRIVSGSRLFLLMFWICENAVHMGEHITMYGLPYSISSRAFDRTFPSDKSHGCPVPGSSTVRSSDQLGLSLRPPYSRSPASWTIRGGESISAIAGPIRWNHLLAFFVISSTL